MATSCFMSHSPILEGRVWPSHACVRMSIFHLWPFLYGHIWLKGSYKRFLHQGFNHVASPFCSRNNISSAYVDCNMDFFRKDFLPNYDKSEITWRNSLENLKLRICDFYSIIEQVEHSFCLSSENVNCQNPLKSIETGKNQIFFMSLHKGTDYRNLFSLLHNLYTFSGTV